MTYVLILVFLTATYRVPQHDAVACGIAQRAAQHEAGQYGLWVDARCERAT